MKTHNTPKSVAEEITILEQVLDQINDTPSVSKELLNALAEALFDVLQSDINPPQAIDVVIQAFDYLMCNDEYYLFQRKLLSIHSRGDKKVLSKAATTFGLRLNELVLAKQPPDKGLLIQLLILRNYIGKLQIHALIPKWHLEAIPKFNNEESLLLYNTMFNQNKFMENVIELQSELPKLNLIEQWLSHGTKKLMTYLYFWPRDCDTKNLKALQSYLTKHQMQKNTIEFNDFLNLLNISIENGGETIKSDPTFWSKINLIKGIATNYAVPSLLKAKRKPRVAILVSGQLRGYEHTIKNWQKHLLANIEADFYVHTWNEIGMSGTQAFRSQLPFEGKEFNKAYRTQCNKMGYGSFVQHYPSLFHKVASQGRVTKNHLSEIYKTDNIIIEDGEATEFEGWSNPRKMYYKISQVQSMLDQSGKEYDIVLRIRPDKDIRLILGRWFDIENSVQNNNLILSDFGYGVHYGSLMIGDQFAVGSQKTMQKYSSTYTDALKLVSLEEGFSVDSFLDGHTSIARQCALNKITIGRFPALFGGLKTAANLTTDTIQKMISQDANGRLDEFDKSLLTAIEKDLAKNVKVP